ncbi:uncharacterized protein HaLaN_14855, partial [Haematococcus lacustris]
PEDEVQCQAELLEAQQIRELWAHLSDEADQVDMSLEQTKKVFSETTRKQVLTVSLAERFRTSGPGLATIELPVGLELLHAYAAELEGALKQREQLALAEKLFDMEITGYPSLAMVEAEMKKLQQVREGVGRRLQQVCGGDRQRHAWKCQGLKA